MTIPTLARRQPPAAAGRDRFGCLLRSEWTKLRTVRGWVIALVVAALLTILFGVWTASASQSGCNGGPCHYVIPTGPGGEAVTDTFYFVHRPLGRRGRITVRVTSLTSVRDVGGMTPQGPQGTQPAVVPWSKAGLIVTAGPSQGAAYAAVMVTRGHGTRMQWNYTGDTAGLPGAVTPASPRWLRLTRAGDVITGYDSANGASWTKIGAVTLPGLAPAVQAGLFATSPQYTQQVSGSLTGATTSGGDTQATATFDHVSPRGGWAGTAVNGGANAISAGGATGGYHQAGGTFTITGSGDIAPGTGGPGSIGGIDQPLAGLFIGLIAVVVIGALFITAEYRRGLIRVTLTASPRRGRLLAAKAIVLGSAAFAAGLAGSAGAILIGVPLLRANGNAIAPASALTELRVIAGTAALVAVAAVFALGVGAILRHSAGAVAVVLTAMTLPYLMTAAFPALSGAAGDWLLRITPAAGFAIKQAIPAYPQVAAGYAPVNGYFPLSPGAGFAVLCGYAAVALAVAAVLLRRRDA